MLFLSPSPLPPNVDRLIRLALISTLGKVIEGYLGWNVLVSALRQLTSPFNPIELRTSIWNFEGINYGKRRTKRNV